MMESVTKMGRTVGIVANNRVKNTIIPSDGDITMWGTPGSGRASIVKHDAASKVQAAIDAERIQKAGRTPKIEVIRTTDHSKYGSDGIVFVKYKWQAIEEAPQEDPNTAPHV